MMQTYKNLIWILLLFSIGSIGQEFSTLGEIYDFEVGDEFQIITSQIIIPYNDTVYTLEKKVISQKEIKQDKLFYTLNVFQYSILNNNFPPFELNMINNYMDSLIVTKPDSIIFSIENNDTVYHNPDLYNGRKINQKDRFMANQFTTNKFAEGCGLVKYYSFSTMHLSEFKDSLIYYKKGEETWGNDAVLGQNENTYSSSILQLYPNPVSDILNIQLQKSTLPNQILIEIYDISGKLISKSTSGKNQFIIDCSALKKGLYFLHIDSGGISLNSKFIKQ